MGGQFRGMIDQDSAEMDAVCKGFEDTMKGQLVGDPAEILAKYGPEINKVLQERSGRVVDKMKEDGAAFAKEFVNVNPEAVTTDSGLVYLSMTEVSVGGEEA
jgi:hypothetical protein